MNKVQVKAKYKELDYDELPEEKQVSDLLKIRRKSGGNTRSQEKTPL